MHRLSPYRPSPALVVALCALFVALGGTGYAVVALPKNSVGTKQLKRNAVISSKVKNFSLLRRDFKRGQLPAGPRGTRGVAGLQGPKGDRGDIGLRGDLGPTGPTGVTGATGPQGAQGQVLSSTGQPNAVGMNFYSYFMSTTGPMTDFPFGQAKIQTTGVSGQFKVCGNIPGASGNLTYVAYVNGVRSVGTVAANGGCSAALTVGAAGDFTASIRRALIFGVHSGDDPTATSYNLYGFSQL